MSTSSENIRSIISRLSAGVIDMKDLNFLSDRLITFAKMWYGMPSSISCDMTSSMFFLPALSISTPFFDTVSPDGENVRSMTYVSPFFATTPRSHPFLLILFATELADTPSVLPKKRSLGSDMMTDLPAPDLPATCHSLPPSDKSSVCTSFPYENRFLHCNSIILI